MTFYIISLFFWWIEFSMLKIFLDNGSTKWPTSIKLLLLLSLSLKLELFWDEIHKLKPTDLTIKICYTRVTFYFLCSLILKRSGRKQVEQDVLSNTRMWFTDWRQISDNSSIIVIIHTPVYIFFCVTGIAICRVSKMH